MKRIRVFALILAVFAIFAVTGCKNDGNDFAGWVIEEQRVNGNAEGSALQYYGIFRLSSDDGNKEVKDIWLNLSGVQKEDITINLAFSHTSTIASPKEIAITVSKSEIGSDGWCKIYEKSEEETYNHTYFEIFVTDTMVLNEMAIVNANGKLLKTSLTECGMRPNRGSSSAIKYTNTELDEAIEAGTVTNSAFNLFDEQEKFDK